MSETREPDVGTVAWTDLTVEDAEGVRRFYEAVVGWTSEPVDMGGYRDFNMTTPEGGRTVAGICHARGGNADLPARWLVYLVVDDLDASIERCRELGGEVVAPPRGDAASGRFCVIRDPAGAVAALFQAGA